MSEFPMLSLSSVYENSPPVFVTKIKDEITGEDNQALITENAVVNYIDQHIDSYRYVPARSICCNFPNIEAGHLFLEHINGYGWVYTIDYCRYRKPDNRNLDCGQRNYLLCALKYLSKYFFFNVRGPISKYSHLVPNDIPQHYYEDCNRGC